MPFYTFYLGAVIEYDAGIAAGFLGSFLTLECPVNITENDTLEWSDTVYNQGQILV